MGIQIAHFPTVKTLDDFDFKFQPSLDQKLVRELASGHFIAGAENLLLLGPPGVDELGYLPLEKHTAHLFFQLVSRRYERGSMLVTTNQTITLWGQVFGDETIATAVLDRLLHHSHVLIVQGDSYRLRQKKRAGLLGSTKSNH
jgi:DNA replication protein DnaC